MIPLFKKKVQVVCRCKSGNWETVPKFTSEESSRVYQGKGWKRWKKVVVVVVVAIMVLAVGIVVVTVSQVISHFPLPLFQRLVFPCLSSLRLTLNTWNHYLVFHRSPLASLLPNFLPPPLLCLHFPPQKTSHLRKHYLFHLYSVPFPLQSLSYIPADTWGRREEGRGVTFYLD